MRWTSFPWLTRVRVSLLAVVAASKLEVSVSWGKKAREQYEGKRENRRRSEMRPSNCVLALFSADRVSAFIALRRTRYKRVFAEGSWRFPFPEGSKSSIRTFSAFPRRERRGKERSRRTGIRLESRHNIALPIKVRLRNTRKFMTIRKFVYAYFNARAVLP